MNIQLNRYFWTVLRWAFAGVFVYAGATKLGSPQSFSDSIATFDLFPNNTINLIALVLPPFEILAGLAVASGIQRRAAVLGLTSLTAVFIALLGSAIVRGIPVDCGCFGSGSPSTSGSWLAVGRDLLLLATGIALYVQSAKANGASRINAVP